MREHCTSGSARGVPGNRHSYRRGASRRVARPQLLPHAGGLWGSLDARAAAPAGLGPPASPPGTPTGPGEP